MQQSIHVLQGSTNTPSRASPKPWVPPAVIDDNSSAFARYAASHRAFMGSGPPSRASSSALSSQVRVLGQTAAFHLRAQRAFSSPAPGHRPAGPVKPHLVGLGMASKRSTIQGNGSRRLSVMEYMLAGRRFYSQHSSRQQLTKYDSKREGAHADEHGRPLCRGALASLV